MTYFDRCLIAQFPGKSLEEIKAMIPSMTVGQRALIAARIACLAHGSNQYVSRIKHDPITGKKYRPHLRVKIGGRK